MNSAAFLLAINGAIGLSFAGVFLALTWRSEVRLGRWCAAGFLAAAATVTVEGLAFEIPWPRLTSSLSFGLLMLALTTITAGLIKHYRPSASIGWLFGVSFAADAANTLFVLNLPRGTWGQALGYQGPFALMVAVAAFAVVFMSPRRPVDLALATVLGLSSAQFLIKAALAAVSGSGPSVRSYLFSAYAFYSQTAGGILSLLLGLALVGMVVTEVMAEVRNRLQRDMLTGLLNRAAFMERVPDVLRSAGARPVAVIMADLDHFKSINDGYGHAAGDEVLRAFGKNLLAYFDNNVLCGRLGGEEFCILVPDCGPAAACDHLDRLRWLSQQHGYELLPQEFAVTASYGVAFVCREEPLEGALRRADMALYEAKAAGRDRYSFAPIARPGAGEDPSRALSAVSRSPRLP